MTPTQQVFAIPELLEQILLNLDTRTLFLSQRTNKTFHQVIADSSKIQRRLWLKSDPDRETGLDKSTNTPQPSSYAINPIFLYEGDPYPRNVWSNGLNLRVRLSHYSMGCFHPAPATHLVIECARDVLDARLGNWQHMILVEGKREVMKISWYCFGGGTDSSVKLRGEVRMVGPLAVGQLVAEVRAEDMRRRLEKL